MLIAAVSYDVGYDNRAKSLTTVACSDGQNGLIWKYDWSTVGDIPSFPFIGGYQGVTGWNSTQVRKPPFDRPSHNPLTSPVVWHLL